MAVLDGYEEELIVRMNRKHRKRHDRKGTTTLKPIGKRGGRKVMEKGNVVRHVSFPYYKGITDKIGRRMKSSGLNVVYHGRGSLRNLIGSTKRKRPNMEKSGIYNIECKGCEVSYIGQTRRRIDARLKEHDRARRLKQEGKSAMADHCMSRDHDMGTCTVLKEVQNPLYLDAWESIYITKGINLVNVEEAPISSKLFDFASIEKRN
jgi:predicted GIY-YIG superfamily endonuclease